MISDEPLDRRPFPRRDELEPRELREYTVRITGSGPTQDFLCLEYLVFAVPPALVGDHATQEGDAAGLAVHGSTVRRCCRSGYRTAADGTCVVGAVKIGLNRERCEARLVVADGRVRSARITTMAR